MSQPLAQRALEMLEDALRRPPRELTAEVDEVERAVVALRDDLIRRVRALPPGQPSDAVEWRCLNEVNLVLSFVVGIEYPVGGFQRGLIEQARGVLQNVLADMPSG